VINPCQSFGPVGQVLLGKKRDSRGGGNGTLRRGCRTNNRRSQKITRSSRRRPAALEFSAGGGEGVCVIIPRETWKCPPRPGGYHYHFGNQEGRVICSPGKIRPWGGRFLEKGFLRKEKEKSPKSHERYYEKTESSKRAPNGSPGR